MADGKAMVLTFTGKWADDMPHFAKVVEVILFMYMVYAPLPLLPT